MNPGCASGRLCSFFLHNHLIDWFQNSHTITIQDPSTLVISNPKNALTLKRGRKRRLHALLHSKVPASTGHTFTGRKREISNCGTSTGSCCRFSTISGIPGSRDRDRSDRNRLARRLNAECQRYEVTSRLAVLFSAIPNKKGSRGVFEQLLYVLCASG